jgi:hypothetical protein
MTSVFSSALIITLLAVGPSMSTAQCICSYCAVNGDRLSCQSGCPRGTQARDRGMLRCTAVGVGSTNFRRFNGCRCPYVLSGFRVRGRQFYGPVKPDCSPKVLTGRGACDAIYRTSVSTTCPPNRADWRACNTRGRRRLLANTNSTLN